MTPDIVHAMKTENRNAISDVVKRGLPAKEVRTLCTLLHNAEITLTRALLLTDDRAKHEAARAAYYEFSLALDNHIDLLCERYGFSMALHAAWHRVRNQFRVVTRALRVLAWRWLKEVK